MNTSTFWLARDEVRELDRRAIGEYGVPGIVLMENAGRGCAELLMQLNPERHGVMILCGPGNNGGDGFVIARHLLNHRHTDPFTFIQCDPIALSGDALTNYQIHDKSAIVIKNFLNWHQNWTRFGHDPIGTSGTGWFVDALFGTGLNRGLSGDYEKLVEFVNASGNPVLAVDIPSGLDCDTGEPLGPTIRATHTATFVAHKKGFLNPKSREWTGDVHVIDIGAPHKLIDEYRTRRRTE